MPKYNLTDPFIRHHPAPEKRLEIYDDLVTGLAVRITKTGHKSFVYRYRFNNRVKRFTIGSYPKISLAKARDEAKELAYKISQGIDPLQEKKNRKSLPQPKTFYDLTEAFKKQHLPMLKPSTQKSYRSRIDNEILPALKDRTIKSITKGEIIDLLENIVYDRGKPVHANRVRSILSIMFNFAAQRDWSEKNPVKLIAPMGKEKSRERVYTEDEIKELWEAFSVQREPVRSVLMILLTCGQRKSETCKMRWRHIKDNVWIIPKELAKAGRTHYVPLSPLAQEIINQLDQSTPFVFQSSKRENMPIQRLQEAVRRIRKLTGIDDFRIHDMRRTAATYMAELGTDRTILGKVLNHKGLAGDTQVTAVYDRYDYMDEKRTALNRWARHLERIVNGEAEATIHKIGS